jgi:hypothetical protein
MKRFKQFLNRKNINPYDMVHGSHAHDKKIDEAWGSSSNEVSSDFYSLSKPKQPGLLSRLLSTTSKALKLTGPTTDDWKRENDNSHIGKDLNSVHQTLNGQTEDLSKHPDFKELVRYTQWSKDLNNSLRTHGVNRTTPPETVEGINTTKLDNLVSGGRTRQSMTVYHGPGFHPLELAQRHPNLEFTNPGYTSTSIDKPTARRFGSIYLEQGGKQVPYADVPTASINDEKHRHVMSINVPQGHPGLYIGNQTLPEYEHLLPRNTTFRLRSTTPRTYRDVSENGGKDGYTHVWDADVVPQEKE